MDTRYIPFTQAIDSIVKSAPDRSKIIAHALALALSRRLPLPSSENMDIDSYYTLQLLGTVRDTLSGFNEEVIFDLRCALELTRQFWMMRYSNVYPDMTWMDMQRGFFDIVTGATKFFSMDTTAFVNQYKLEVLELSTRATALMNEVR